MLRGEISCPVWGSLEAWADVAVPRAVGGDGVRAAAALNRIAVDHLRWHRLPLALLAKRRMTFTQATRIRRGRAAWH